MNEQQLYFAHLYLCNSALFVTEEALKTVEKNKDLQGRVDSVPIAPLFNRIKENKAKLAEGAYTVVTNDGEFKCTEEKAQDLADEATIKGLVLEFSRRGILLRYGMNSRPFEKGTAEILRYLLINTTL